MFVEKIILKSGADLEAMRSAGAVAGKVLAEILGFIRPGVTTNQVDRFAGERMAAHGAKSAFLGYRKY